MCLLNPETVGPLVAKCETPNGVFVLAAGIDRGDLPGRTDVCYLRRYATTILAMASPDMPRTSRQPKYPSGARFTAAGSAEPRTWGPR